MDKIKYVDYESEMSSSYVNYAMSVITGRALPDIRDGLKPVQRRILYTLNSLAKPDTPHRKCARIVGDTMGKFHPHGDASIYEALVNMGQPWKLPIPLVESHGNFGSVSGDGAAAMRYTEARLSKFSEDACFKYIKYFKEDFISNFDGTEDEPQVLPFQIPNILVSGSSGIAVGMATNIPSHNLGEVIDATIMYLRNPKVELSDVLSVLKGPDFATGGIINASYEDIYNIYDTGTGKIKVRGKVEVRDAGYGRKSICVTELPFTMIGGTAKFLDTVADLARNHEIEGVVDIADRGDSESECLCIDIKKGMTDEQIQNIINILYKKAGLEDTFGASFNCISDGKPEVMGLLTILNKFCVFKRELYIKQYQKLLDEQINVQEVKSGLIKAIDCIDLIIEILRGSKNVSIAKNCLMHGETKDINFRFKGSEADAKLLRFSEIQADAILGMKLQKLIGLEINALKKELAAAEKLIKKYSNILKNDDVLVEQMICDLEELKHNYNTERKTQIADCGQVVIRKEEEIAQEVAVLLDRFYYIKVIDAGVLAKNIEQISKEYRFFIKCMSSDRVGIFTDDNQMHMIKVQDIIKNQAKKNTSKKGNSLLAKLSDKGIQMFDFCNMNGDESILYMECIENFVNKNLIFVNTKGYAKKVKGENFDVSRKTIAAAKENEQICFVGHAENTNQLVTISEKGFAARFSLDEIKEKGKNATGGKLMLLSDDDCIKDVFIGGAKDMFKLKDDYIPFSKIKISKPGSKGTKLRIKS